MGSMISNMNATRLSSRPRLMPSNIICSSKVSKEMEAKVIRWFDYLWTNKKSVDEREVLKTCQRLGLR